MSKDTEELFEDNTKEIVNISSQTVRFQIDNQKIVMQPGDRRRINANYATARALQPNRDPVPSVVELLTNKMVLPVDHPKVPKQFREVSK